MLTLTYYTISLTFILPLEAALLLPACGVYPRIAAGTPS